MTSVNVNLNPCDCAPLESLSGDVHLSVCASTPVLIPCPIPRSVTMTVRFGECDCKAGVSHYPECHLAACPARPIRVDCSIGGKTWEESEVTACDSRDLVYVPDAVSAACRARWKIVQALVTGAPISPPYTLGSEAQGLLAQRDAVFAKLAKLAQSEQAYAVAYSEAWESIGQRKAPNMEGLTSTTILGNYVERLIEQMGGLS